MCNNAPSKSGGLHPERIKTDIVKNIKMLKSFGISQSPSSFFIDLVVFLCDGR